MGKIKIFTIYLDKNPLIGYISGITIALPIVLGVVLLNCTVIYSGIIFETIVMTILTIAHEGNFK